ncbi:MAG: hypothetical protein IJ480_07210 [Clostridia bacterium]|nr:hypothetical protein [Clostridia bacterium]
MKKRYDAELERYCKYCEHASVLSSPDRMLCRKRGVVDAGGCCRRFVYDPLKRDPAPTPKLQPMEFVEL